MTQRSQLFLWFLSFLLWASGPMRAAAAAPAEETRRVRLIYLVSSDREENREYTAAIQKAITELQGWYAKQLGGPSFRLSDPVVEVVKSAQPAAWFYSHPNGSNSDDWGYNNALAEARRLVGAKHDDPRFVWVIYSDGPGNKGRGGNGVTCLPEDDLLGLVGRHPTQKDKPRWVAGLGHELGHAFGLPHPADTVKHADAIMWTGIYGKYPNHTYLTEEDKRILLRSPFFYRENGEPVFQLGKVVARFAYAGGSFDQHAGRDPIYWTERKSDGAATFTFVEASRDEQFILLKDESRGFSIRLPAQGGRSVLSTDNGKTWSPLYEVKRAPGE